MNTDRFIDSSRMAARNIASAVVLAAGLAAGSVQALTTTQTFNFGTSPASTNFPVTGVNSLIVWIEKGSLPAGSILRSVTVTNLKLEPPNGSWASNLGFFLDPTPETPGGDGVLKIGADNDYGGSANSMNWSGGDNDGPFTDTRTEASWAGAIDLHDVAVMLGNGWSDNTAYSGTITVEYDVAALGVTLTSPFDTQAYPTGTSITASANVVEPGAFADTVTFHMTPVSPPGSTVSIVSTDTSSPYTANFGVLAAGTYEIYATVINNDDPPGTDTSETHGFTIAAAIPTTTSVSSSANPSTYGSCTLTAQVSPTPAGGTVTFFRNNVALGSPVAVNTITGQATYNANLLDAGPHDITAEFSGYGLHTASTTASALTQTVDKAPLTVKSLNTLRAANTANPDPFPYQITGYQNGQTLATSGVSGTPEITTTAILSSPPGDYPITCAVGTLTAANYSFTFQDGTLTVANLTDTFSVNFYAYPGWMTSEEDRANLRVPDGVPAGLPGSWYTSGWRNVEVPWGGGLQPALPLTSNMGSSATFIFKDCRNGWNWGGDMRTTLLGDGNGIMMDGHVNATLDGDTNKFDMEMTNIPFPAYDVIFYIGANDPQYGDGKGKIVFNGGTERDFTVKPPLFDGTFVEMVDAVTPGNYIVFSGVTGSSFTAQIWGEGPNGFNHIGPHGFQIREAASVSGYSAWQSGNDAAGQTMAQDHDGDGVANGVEYYLVGPSGISTGFTPLPSVADGGGTLSVTWTKGAGYTGVYDTDFVVETSTTLNGPWTVETEPGNVTVTPTGVIYTFPGGPPYTGKRFARLRVTGP